MADSIPKTYATIHLEKVDKIAGFTLEAIPSGEYGYLTPSGFFDSSEEAFHRIAPQVWSMYFVNEHQLESGIDTNRPDFLVLIHSDGTADGYFGSIPVVMTFRAKRDIKASTSVLKKQFADITECQFHGIHVKADDSFVYCFRFHWRFGFCFDFRPSIADWQRPAQEIEQRIGAAYRHLIFFDEFAGFREASANGLLSDGWFPFVELLGGEFVSLVSLYRNPNNRAKLIDGFVNTFDENRLNEFVAHWWNDDLLNSKKEIIMAGIEGFLSNTRSGTIAAIKTLYSEIEGIVRIKYCAEMKRKQASFEELVHFIESKGNDAFHASSVAFPAAFYRYLREQIFAHFDVSADNVPLSRHSTSHGVARADAYTRTRALQAIFTLDQVRYFITSR